MLSYGFIKGSITPISEQTCANKSSTAREMRLSWYSTIEHVTSRRHNYPDQLKYKPYILLHI